MKILRASWLLLAAALATVGCAPDTFVVGTRDASTDVGPFSPFTDAGAGEAGTQLLAADLSRAEEEALCAALLPKCVTCRVDRDGNPVCACPAGKVFDGAECLGCNIAPNNDLPLPGVVTNVSAELSVNGQSMAGKASLRLVKKDGLTLTLPVGGTPQAVPTGTYDVFFHQATGTRGPEVPSNRLYPLETVTISAPGPLPFERTATKVIGTVDFGPAHETLSAGYNVGLTAGRSTAVADYADSGRRTFEMFVFPGSYQISVKSNRDAVINLKPITIPEQVEPFRIDLAVPTAKVSVGLTVNGQPPAFSENADLWLVGSIASSILKRVGAAHVYETYAVRGDRYTLQYSSLGGSVSPTHPLQIFNYRYARFDLNQDVTLTMNLPLHRLSGQLKVGGKVTLPNIHKWSLDSDTAGSVHLRVRDDGTYEEWVLPGSYSAKYTCNSTEVCDGQIWPANFSATVDLVEVQGDRMWSRDVPAAPVKISVVEKGIAQIPGTGTITKTQIILFHGDPTAALLAGAGGVSASFNSPVLETQLIPGAYHLSYLRQKDKEELRWSSASSIQVASSGAVEDREINLPLVRVTGSLGIGNVEAYNRLHFDNPGVGRVSFPTNPDGTFAVDVVPGSYIVRYGGAVTGPTAEPRPGQVGCFTFCGPGVPGCP